MHKKVFNPEIFYTTQLLPETISDEIINAGKKILEFDGYKNHIEKGKTVGPILFGLAKYYENKKTLKLQINTIYPLIRNFNYTKIPTSLNKN